MHVPGRTRHFVPTDGFRSAALPEYPARNRAGPAPGAQNPLSKKALIESHSIDYIPLHERHGKVWHLWPVWFAGDAQLATLASGLVGVAAGLNVVWSGLAIILGGALGTFFMAFHSTQGPQLGLPQMIQSRPQFGAMGALLVWLVALITYIGFNAFNQLLAAQSLKDVAGISPGWGAFLFTLAALVIACVGYAWIHYAQRILAALMLVALCLFTFEVVLHPRIFVAQASFSHFMPIPFLTQFFAAASYQLSWSIYVSDYSRYLPRDVGVRASFWWTFLGAAIGGAWMMLVGMFVGAAFPKLDLAGAVQAGGDMVFPHFGVTLLLLSLGGLVTITSLNLYGASLTLLSVVDSFRKFRPTAAKRVATVVLCALAATAIAQMGSGNFVNRFSDLLAVLLYLFTPWTAINLVDFYFVRKGQYSIREILNPNGMYGQWNWRGLLAYCAGFVAMLPFSSTALYTGAVARALGGADISMLIGLPVSAFVYLLACRGLDVQRDARMAALADEGLESAAAAE
jgi:purine-cytosine permease-like protein